MSAPRKDDLLHLLKRFERIEAVLSDAHARHDQVGVHSAVITLSVVADDARALLQTGKCLDTIGFADPVVEARRRTSLDAETAERSERIVRAQARREGLKAAGAAT